VTVNEKTRARDQLVPDEPVELEGLPLLAMSVAGMLAMKEQYPTCATGGRGVTRTSPPSGSSDRCSEIADWNHKRAMRSGGRAANGNQAGPDRAGHDRGPDRVFAFDEFGPLTIRPTAARAGVRPLHPRHLTDDGWDKVVATGPRPRRNGPPARARSVDQGATAPASRDRGRTMRRKLPTMTSAEDAHPPSAQVTLAGTTAANCANTRRQVAFAVRDAGPTSSSPP
jgi:hypothetical protein